MTDITAARWRKSSYSAEHCVEVAAMQEIPVDAWRKSSYCGAEDHDCVEVAVVPEQFAVRDSKNPAGPFLVFSRSAFDDFIDSVKRS